MFHKAIYEQQHIYLSNAIISTRQLCYFINKLHWFVENKPFLTVPGPGGAQ